MNNDVSTNTDKSGRNGHVIILLILVLTCIAYFPVSNNAYIWDDDHYITNNPTLRDGQGLLDMWTEPRSIPQYYPLVHTTFWLEYQMWGLDPLGYHWVNVIIHAVKARAPSC